MTEAATSLFVLALLLAATAAGVVLQPMLPESHRTRDTIEAVRLALTMIVTFAALVLGLLTTSVKGSYDSVDTRLRGYAAMVIQTDQSLREYGETAWPMERTLRDFTAATIADTWPERTSTFGRLSRRTRARPDSRGGDACARRHARPHRARDPRAAPAGRTASAARHRTASTGSSGWSTSAGC